MSQERWYEVKDIVAMLGVHEQTVRRWIKTGELPGVLFGRKSGYRVRPSDFETFVKRRQTRPEQGKAAA